MTYDAAAQYQAMLDECRAARRARRRLGLAYESGEGIVPAAVLKSILREWDLSPKAILGRETYPEQGEL
jgi:hypothetical protein